VGASTASVQHEQGSPAFEAAMPILSQLLKAEMAEREVRSTAYHMKAVWIHDAKKNKFVLIIKN